MSILLSQELLILKLAHQKDGLSEIATGLKSSTGGILDDRLR
ncbi:hypothetical protein ACN4EG_03480 [Alkalinema pantanalense CENA528]